MSNRSNRDAPLAHAIAGTGGGMIAVLLLQPIDLVKTRMQVQDANKMGNLPRYSSTLNAFTTILRTEGYRAFYQGMSPNLVANGIAWGSYFFAYSYCKNQIKNIFQIEELGIKENFLASTIAGTFTQLLSNPLWMIRTRMQLQTYGEKSNYKGLIDGLRTTWREEGLRGFYAGLTPGIFAVTHGSIQLVIFEELKKSMQKSNNGAPLDSQQVFVASSIGKVVATASTYPTQVVRARMQQRNSEYSSFLGAIKRTWSIEGIRGFYRGLGPHILRVTPGSAITFVAYNKILTLISEQ